MKRTRSLIAALMLAALGGLSPAMAQDDPISGQVIQGWTLPDGRLVAGLDLQLKPGWKTYWRSPGDAGIPPQFDWSRARNVGSVAITWPTPHVFHQNGMRSIGYKDRVVIPLHIQPRSPGQPVRMRMQMDLGVCSEICVPYQLDFDTTLDAAAVKPVPTLAAALAQSPFSRREAGVVAATCALRPVAGGMEVTVRVQMPSSGGAEVAVIEPNIPDVWTSEAETTRSGGWITATAQMLHTAGHPFAVNRSAMRITVLGSQHAVDIQGCTAD
ncbi:protein-disulfide reductase DsbD domain-containing protein [Pseudosulfitobacter koreensis]|uniref:Protein-disulfide reductase DsbD family protein n=1 Tax=Pseudosulfitobacter koreensis TaxID=2968472 RepID=A0ABT1YYX2_9RHOB|nr:protein-disulfide reductase DsbD domain-containing protein [Pseudosulfitobacter koreense]MCR8826084.1 protein-disulfide reductase DsbD family protein [Pseudosulfitobacter koreense]